MTAFGQKRPFLTILLIPKVEEARVILSDIAANPWRLIFKALAIYAAAAWAVVEVIDFAISRYGLSRLLLDIAVLVAFGGGMVTAVLAWFHGDSGRQRVTKSEFITVGAIVLATAAGVTFLALRNPIAPFEQLEGFRLSLELRNHGDARDESYYFSVGPLETSHFDDSQGALFNLAPTEGFVEGPNANVKFSGHPVLILAPEDSEWMTVTFVLPFEPTEISNLLERGSLHNNLNFRTKGIDVAIDSQVELLKQPSGIAFRVE